MESLKSTKKPKDPFQTELSAAVKKHRGFNPHVEYTSESEDDYDDDEYDDDFEEEVSTHHSSLKLSPKYSHKSKQDDDWELPSYLKDDDDDDGYGDGGSMFLKQSTLKKQNKPLFDPLGLNKDSSMPNSGMISEDSESTNNDYADDPILALLNPKPKKEKQPKPAKRHGKNKESDQSFLPTAGPKRSLSPQQSGMDLSGKNFGSSIGYQQKRMKSPVADLSSPKGRKSPSREKVISPNRSAELKRSLEMQDQRSGLIDKRPGSRPKTPQSPMLSGKHSPELKGIITTMKSSDSQISLGESKKKKGSDKSESFVDFLLDPSQPKPAPRKKGSRTTSEGSQPSQSLSPKTIKKENKERKKSPDRLGSPDVLKKQRTLSGERERSKSPKHRSLSPGTDKRTLSSMPLPSLQPMAKPLSTRTINQNQGFQLQGDILPEPVPKVSRAEKEKSHSDADDLLALFNQAIKDEPVDFHAHAREKEKVKSPLDDIVQKTAEQKMHEVPRQRSSRLLIDNVIDNVAQHNDGSLSDHSSMSGKDDHEHKTPRKRSGRKSYRTPPANYQGLGSLTMLKELKKKDEKKDKDDLSQSVTSEDIRKKIYLEWLAKREEEKKIKRKQELKEKKEQEKKLKDEKEDKVKENMIVRKKWEEVKIEQDKEKAKEKRKQERNTEKEKEEKEKQKRKSEKDADKRRQQLLEEAKIKHRAEMKKKHNEEMKIENNKQKQKKENEKAVEKWMDRRSQKWVEDRKKEQKEKSKLQKKDEKDKKEAAEEAEERYKTWRERKDNQLKASMRESRMKERRERYHIEEDEENLQPPWSPPNKVIPRRR